MTDGTRVVIVGSQRRDEDRGSGGRPELGETSCSARRERGGCWFDPVGWCVQIAGGAASVG